jgi:hypothetical protein
MTKSKVNPEVYRNEKGERVRIAPQVRCSVGYVRVVRIKDGKEFISRPENLRKEQ